jgi:hypothetical protein
MEIDRCDLEQVHARYNDAVLFRPSPFYLAPLAGGNLGGARETDPPAFVASFCRTLPHCACRYERLSTRPV